MGKEISKQFYTTLRVRPNLNVNCSVGTMAGKELRII